MAKGTNMPITHFYNEVNIGKHKTVKHYELAIVDNGTPQLSQLINISKDRQFAKSAPSYWLKLRLANKWSASVTGLFKTAVNGLVYSGDFDDKTHLVLFEFSKNATKLKIYFYLNYFPFDTRLHPATVAKRIMLIPKNT